MLTGIGQAGRNVRRHQATDVSDQVLSDSVWWSLDRVPVQRRHAIVALCGRPQVAPWEVRQWRDVGLSRTRLHDLDSTEGEDRTGAVHCTESAPEPLTWGRSTS